MKLYICLLNDFEFSPINKTTINFGDNEYDHRHNDSMSASMEVSIQFQNFNYSTLFGMFHNHLT